MGVLEKHFVTFFSPGTFVHEESCKPIGSWDVEVATKMAHDITERYGATPFAFQFSTRSRGPNDLDSKETARSPTYYLGGTIMTAEEVLAGTDPKEDILRSNVRGNGYKRIIVNDNSWRVTLPLKDDDVVLDFKPKKRRKSA